MTLPPGTRLGPYEITAQIGVGGMGEVYRATDTTLARQVAIKVLPEALASDADRIARFEREAKTLAALNHPNIAQIYGVEKSGGAHALVMELVEGPTLADRIAQGAIPVDEALPIAKQIAEALEAAHEQGIIHRDLKPANIKVTADGVVKVLDFGLAKLAHTPATGLSALDVTASPTVTSPALLTAAGVILGTAAYMSPEQAKGREADRRSDLWSFGCVLYEMLTAKRLFAGDGVSETLAAVLRENPDWSTLPTATPPEIRTLLRRCLEKDRKRRLESAADARLEIDEALLEPTTARRGVGWPAAARIRPAWIGAAVALALLAAGGAGTRFLRAPAAAAPEMRTQIVTLDSTDPLSFALSPDGKQLAFVGTANGPSRLWLRPLAAATAQPLGGTEGATAPFWSPDSRSVGFFADGALKRLDLSGGIPRVLVNTKNGRGATWNQDGVILFSPSTEGPVLRVAASGGDAVAVTTLRDGQRGHRWPRFLPDGRRFVFTALGTVDSAGIYLGSIDSGQTMRLAADTALSVYLPPEWLLWVRNGTLVAQHLDLQRGAVLGDPVTLADRVGFDAGTSASGVSVSDTGLIAYRPGGATGRQLRWFDRAGQALGVFGDADVGLSAPRVSPDGRRAAVGRTAQGTNFDVWLLDEARTSRFTFDAALDQFPVWSPDGSQIVFSSTRTGVRNLYVRAASGAGAERVLLESPQGKSATDWSADGEYVIFHSADLRTDQDLWVLPVNGERTPSIFLKTPFAERQGQFSPDVRWVAYTSNESGRYEIYVRSFAMPRSKSTVIGEIDGGVGTAGQWQVSTQGGICPRWRFDGKELYYLGSDGQIMAAPIDITGKTLAPGTPVKLFDTRTYGGGAENGLGCQYDVARNGRFLINSIVDESTTPITLIQNWRAPPP